MTRGCVRNERAEQQVLRVACATDQHRNTTGKQPDRLRAGEKVHILHANAELRLSAEARIEQLGLHYFRPARRAQCRSVIDIEIGIKLVGALSLRPNLINVVPNRAVFTVDLRNTDEAKLKEAEVRVAAHIAEVAAAERVEVEAKVLARFEPVIFDAALVDRVEHHARALSLSTRRMPSGAGHDAQMMQRLCPTAMIFVPSVAGLSHNVKEHTEAADLVVGAQVLLNLMLELAEA